MSPPIDWEPLVEAALAAQQRAYAPYSRFPVGAALLMEDGSVVAGCNVENRSFGLTVCAERNAVTTAVALGRTLPQAAVVVTGTSPPSPPCGMCLESLAEFAREMPILLVNPAGERVESRLEELLPCRFEWSGPHGD
ncbi:MAG TPA: cytidine deaminase [Thermoanaerobaculia bacterium]|nr:cytidine deaminase [Thermoanaerobaculia bacterium]